MKVKLIRGHDPLDHLIWFFCLLVAVFITVIVIVGYRTGDFTGFAVDSDSIMSSAGPLIGFLLRRENWIFVHLTVPFFIRMLAVQTLRSSALICLIWEFFETSVFFAASLINMYLLSGSAHAVVDWIGETPQDSLVGDFIIDMAGVFVAELLLRAADKKLIAKMRALRRRVRFAETLTWFIALASVSVLGIICVRLRNPIELGVNFGGNLPITHTVHYFGLGHVYYLLLALPILRFMSAYEQRFYLESGGKRAEEMKSCCAAIYDCASIVLVWNWIGSYFLLYPTYIALAPTIVLFCCYAYFTGFGVKPVSSAETRKMKGNEETVV